MQGCHVTDQQMTLRQTHTVSVAAAKAGIIPTAKKVDTFLAVLCLTAETLRVSAFLVAVSTRSLHSLSPTAGRGLRLYPEALSR